jgi:hypothetical protein
VTWALIGHTGLVGGTLARQATFDRLFHSTNIEEIVDERFELVVCAALPAQKWIANREPDKDRQNLDRLVGCLNRIVCQEFVLLSTVDVFTSPLGVDESCDVDARSLHPYGRHRRALEEFVQLRFPRAVVVRLAGLVGPGLKKNVLFDLRNRHELQNVDSRSVYQFYPLANLWHDIGVARAAGLDLIHLTAAPLDVATIARLGFGVRFRQHLQGTPAAYDFRTRHSSLYGADGPYQYGARDSLAAIHAYARSNG